MQMPLHHSPKALASTTLMNSAATRWQGQSDTAKPPVANSATGCYRKQASKSSTRSVAGPGLSP